MDNENKDELSLHHQTLMKQIEHEASRKVASDIEEKDYDLCKEGPQPGPPMPSYSINNRVIVESYKEDRGLKATVNNGFAMVSQKVTVKGMKALMDADLTTTQGQFYNKIRKGDMVYIREEYLQSQSWAKKSFQSDAIDGDFMIVDLQYIEFVVPK